jgi:hypothetical protein
MCLIFYVRFVQLSILCVKLSLGGGFVICMLMERRFFFFLFIVICLGIDFIHVM